jgi:hypothetical protein
VDEQQKKIAQIISIVAIVIMVMVMLKLSKQFDEMLANSRRLIDGALNERRPE